MKCKPKHLVVSETDGALYDTRNKDWYKLKPLRPIYKRTFTQITNTQEFKATLRNEPFTWPGGYPLFLFTHDGEALCFDCAKGEARSIMSSIKDRINDGWLVIGTSINEENDHLCCGHCGENIESSYGDYEEKEE